MIVKIQTPSLLSEDRERNMVRHVWLGAKTLMPGLVFIYMHQIHSSIFAPSVDGWRDYVCIRRSLACLQGAIWGRLYHVCTRSGPRFDVLAMKLPSFQLKTFTVLLKWFDQCIKSWGIWITHLQQLQTITNFKLYHLTKYWICNYISRGSICNRLLPTVHDWICNWECVKTGFEADCIE